MEPLVKIVGCGQMGSSLAEGMVESGVVNADHLICIDRKEKKAKSLADRVGAYANNIPADANQTVYIFAVKPKDIEQAIRDHKAELTSKDVVVSIAAGVPLDQIKTLLDTDAYLVRGMPNTPASIGKGATALYSESEEALEIVGPLFKGVGKVVELKSEKDFHAVTALSGSGPAFVFVLLEALADGAVQLGLDRQTARVLAQQTVAGSVALAEESDCHTAELKDQVASPGGTTITGLAELEKRGFRASLISAVETAGLKSIEMSGRD